MASERTSSYRQSDAETIARFEAAAKSAAVVSFDLFDTLVTRPLARPIDLFSAMQPHLPEAWAPAAGDFGSARVAAEMTARETAALAGRRDVTLAEIYDALAGATGIDRAALDALAALETRFEVAATRADPMVVGAFDRLVAAGKRVIVVTDMYLPRETIEAILAASGIAGFERVFISAETDAPKGDGSAWAHVRHALGLAATDAIVHIGDNPGSDGRAAERAGVGGFVLTPPQERRARGWTYRPGDWLTEAFAALGAQAERHDDDPETAYWRRLGYGLVAPSALAMAAFILAEARGRGSERVHFLARDGLVFRQAYDLLFAEADAPPSNYLWASRRCFNFAAIDQLDKDSMEFLVGSLTRIRVRDFLVRVGIDPDEDAVRREIEARLSSADQTIERG
ncbi:MAG TPA: hypothetical protein PLJ34_05315, partial [Hyphomicrobiales bacterium]|nr:hypothetical protein [Hyphomicrobiales bacterium]